MEEMDPNKPAKLKENHEGLKQLDKNVMQFLEEVCDEIVIRSKNKAPVWTGKLRESLRTLYMDENLKAGYPGSDVYYGLYQELGTRKFKGTPHLRPAADEVINEIDRSKGKK